MAIEFDYTMTTKERRLKDRSERLRLKARIQDVQREMTRHRGNFDQLAGKWAEDLRDIADEVERRALGPQRKEVWDKIMQSTLAPRR